MKLNRSGARDGRRRIGGAFAVLAGSLAFGLAATGPGAAAGPADSAAPARSGSCAAAPAETDRNRSVLVSIRCRTFSDLPARPTLRPRHGRLGHLNQRRDTIRYFPERGFEGVDRFRIARSGDGVRLATNYRVLVEAPENAPRCEDRELAANYAEPTRFRITCRGRGLEALEIGGEPHFGTAEVLDERGGDARRTITIRHTPFDGFSGEDFILVRARDGRGSSFGTVKLTVAPWKMRAFGDSVTAGFGYLGDGTEIGVDDVPDCKPTASTLNDRCSSNSDKGPEYDQAAPSWSADYGLGNDVAWPAQFANDLQGGGKVTAPVGFQNLAVTGSAPSDWLPGGSLNATLDELIADDPDLIVLTMGANPLLDDVLLTEKGEECSEEDTVAELEACVLPFFEDADLEGNLEALYEDLFAADSAEIVVLQYHLSIPALNFFDEWQLEAIGNLLNEQIETAVDEVRDRQPAEADRLHLVRSQVDPTDPEPDEIARFNIGFPPVAQQTWTAPYDCGFDDYVDGPSHQSEPTQDEFFGEDPLTFCKGDEWIIGIDSGIHPSTDGYAQFASALGNYATENDLVPPLP